MCTKLSFWALFWGLEGTLGFKIVESLHASCALLLKLNSGAPLWICLLCELFVCACNVCWAPGAGKRHGIAICGSELFFAMPLANTALLNNLHECGHYHSKLKPAFLWIWSSHGLVAGMCNVCWAPDCHRKHWIATISSKPQNTGPPGWPCS